MLEQLSIDGIGEEAANIASPLKEFFKLLSKAVVELRFPERHLCNVLWAHETLVSFNPLHKDAHSCFGDSRLSICAPGGGSDALQLQSTPIMLSAWLVALSSFRSLDGWSSTGTTNKLSAVPT